MYLFYLFLWIALMLFVFSIRNKFDNRSKKILYLFFLFTFVLLVGLRYDKLPDYSQYKYMFDSMEYSDIKEWNLFEREPNFGVEYGYLYIMKIIRLFTKDFRVFSLFIEAFFLPLMLEYLYKVIDKIDESKLIGANEYEIKISMLLVYSSYYALNYDMIAVRAMISICACVVGFYYFIDKHYIWSMIVLLLGFFVQRMTLLGILMILFYYFTPKIKNKKLFISLCMLILAILLFMYKTNRLILIIAFLNNIYNSLFRYINYFSYIDYNATVFTLGIRKIVDIFIIVFILLNANYNKRWNSLFNELLVGGSLIFVLLNVGSAWRVYDYFLIFTIPILSYIILENKKHKSLNVIFICIIFVKYLISFRVWELV